MNINQAGLDLIKRYEGFSSIVYKDSAGKETIGYGHLILPGENLTYVNDQQAEKLLLSDAKIAVDAVNRLLEVPVSQNQFNALVSFTFNLGAGALARSFLLKNINSGVPVNTDNFYSWNKVRKNGVLTFSQGLANRRLDELSVYLA